MDGIGGPKTPEKRVCEAAEITRRWRKGELSARECDAHLASVYREGPPAYRIGGTHTPEIQTSAPAIEEEVDE